ncbi:MAG: hypothetical protein FWB94_04820 [Chitinispirillia bacterium]|nr:hypothetical protein [Chitinispirillia bacterium]
MAVPFFKKLAVLRLAAPVLAAAFLILAGCSKEPSNPVGPGGGDTPSDTIPGGGDTAITPNMPGTGWYTASPDAATFFISTVADLAGLAQIVNGTWDGTPARYDFSGKIILLSSNINLSSFGNWTPIGDYAADTNNVFSGTFNGNGYAISNLSINRSGADYQGLFGCIRSGKVERVKLTGVNIRGRDNAGGIAGSIADYSSITQSNSAGAVSGRENVGGVAGHIRNNSGINKSYSTGTVSGVSSVGGITGGVAGSYSSLANCYSTATVAGTGGSVGGVAGYLITNSSMTNCYSTGTVSGINDVGGVAGRIDGNSNLSKSAALNLQVKGTGANIGRVAGAVEGTLSDNAAYSEMINNSGVAAWNNKGADQKDGDDITAKEVTLDATIGNRFTGDWWITNGYLPGINDIIDLPAHLAYFTPGTRWYINALAANHNETNFTITAAEDLAGLAEIVNGTWVNKPGTPRFDNFSGKTIKLARSVDLSSYDNWTAIGTLIYEFSGTFDGGGYVINNLTINTPDEDDFRYYGLFGRINNGRVVNLGLDKVNINGNNYVGALVGNFISGTISNCYSSGTVSGTGNMVGGIAGTVDNNGIITKTYSTAAVSSTGRYIGGIAGQISNGSSIENSYATGTVTAGVAAGGIAGWIDNNSRIIYCYSTGAISSNDVGGGISGWVGAASSVTYSAALNPEVKANIFVGRVTGVTYGDNPLLSNNVAFAEMINNDGGTAWNDKGKGDMSGEDISAADIAADGTIGWRFTAAEGWTTANGMLPGLNGQTEPRPLHLR